MRIVCSSLDLLAGIDFGHSAHSSTPQPRVLIAVPPAVDRSLNQASLAAKAWVQFCQSPTDCVTLRLVHQAIASVLVFCATCARVDAIFSLELGAQRVHVDRFYIASDRVFHLDPVARVFECNPLHAIPILSHDQWGRCWNRPRSRIWVDRTIGNIVCVHRGPILWMLWRTQRPWRGSLKLLLRQMLNLGSGTARHARLLMLLARMLHRMLTRGMGHEQIGLRCHALMVLLWMLPIRRRPSMRWHRRVRLRRGIIHRLLQLGCRLAIHRASMLIMA